jgi:class 3 adenylate cyclase/tetratricopeptide (TPR) repeat protein
MKTRKEIENAISQLESQREILGNAAVDASLVELYRKLTELDKSETIDRTRIQATERIGERRVVTVLFCDVTGSTALAESMDPEAWTGIMKEAFQYLIEPVERYGGTVARLMGDAILAFFGAPTAHEDDPQRAILAGLGIVENIQPYREKLRKEKGLEFNVRVGINTGLAVVGDVGSETAGEYTAMGDAVNLAARMEQTAAPGTVQVAQDTYTLVAPLFDFKELGSIQVKGKREPVRTYQVLGKKTEPGSLRGLTGQGISSPLVGRESEFEETKGTLERLLTGHGGILAILGEAGIGKSRLMSELRNATEDSHREPDQADQSLQSVRWLVGQTLSYGQTISYWPFQQILREYTGISGEDSESEALLKLERSVKQLFAEETAEILPYLASLLSIEVSGDYTQRLMYLDSEALGRQVYRATRRFFQRLAKEQPLVLMFDDLHWMDASSAGLLEHLMPLVERVPLLLCCLSRPEADSPAARLLEIAENKYGDYFTAIELAPLSSNDSRQLVQHLLQIDGLPDQKRHMILAKADGNPFYLEEIVRSLIENGALVQESKSGRWLATQQIENITIPDTIQGLLIARIDRLDEHLKRIVRQAAVIGRAFLFRVLDAVLDDESDLDRHLSRLQSVELIWEKQRIPELEYIFKHALAQEAAYESILREERRDVHRRVGAAIETLMADKLNEFYGLLAYHFSSAEQWEKAQDYLFKAGDQAGSLAADTEALAHYRHALDAYTRVRGDDWEPFERAQLERKMGEAFYRLGDFNQARTYLERSLAFMGVGLPASQWGTRFAIVRALLVQFGHRLFPDRYKQPNHSPPNPLAEDIYKAVLALTWIEAVANIERWFLVSITALNTTEREGYPYGSAYLASVISSVFDAVGQHGLADRYFKLAEVYSQQVTPYRPVFQLAWNRSFHHNMHGNFDKSLEYAIKGLEIADRTGDLRNRGTAMDLAAWAHHIQSRFSEAVETRLEMIAIAEEGSDPQVLCWGHFGLGATRIRLGQLDEAIVNLQRAIEVAEEVPDFHTQLGAGAWLGRCYLAKGELEQALSVVEDSQKLFSVHGIVVDAPYLGNSTSDIYLAAAEYAAGKAREEWLMKAERSCRDTIKVARNNRPTLPDAMMLQGRCKWLRGKHSDAVNWWEKALVEARRIGDLYLEGTIHLEIGHHLGDLEHLKQAISILEDIGAELDLAVARDALADLGGD